jgi:hypothetical protein
MEHQHYDLGQLSEGATVEVVIDTQVNVLLMDEPTTARTVRSGVGVSNSSAVRP